MSSERRAWIQIRLIMSNKNEHRSSDDPIIRSPRQARVKRQADREQWETSGDQEKSLANEVIPTRVMLVGCIVTELHKSTTRNNAILFTVTSLSHSGCTSLTAAQTTHQTQTSTITLSIPPLNQSPHFPMSFNEMQFGVSDAWCQILLTCICSPMTTFDGKQASIRRKDCPDKNTTT